MRVRVLHVRVRQTFATIVLGVLAAGILPVLSASPAHAAPGGGAANLDQCANGSAGTIICAASAWQNGNLNQNKAHWYEGDSVPYRLTMSSVPTATASTVIVQWDTTQQGKHALDYITSFDRSAPGANPCSGVASCNLTSSSSAAIPLDPNVGADPTFHGTQVPGRFTLYGGAITAVSGYTVSGSYAGSSATSIAVTFKASTATPVLAWGGHISTQFDWSLGRSAISINGSPYHTRLISLNGQGGNQDRSLHTAAITTPGALVVRKRAFGGDGTFTFNGTAVPNGNLGLMTTAGDAQSNLIVLPPSTIGYTLSETATAGWDLTGLTCSDPVPGNASTTSGPTATVRLDSGETVTCTYSNTKHGSVTVVKQTSGGDGTFDFSLTGQASKPVATTGGIGSATWDDVPPGNLVLSEAVPGHWSFASAACTAGGQPVAATPVASGIAVALAPGAALTCAFANTRLGSLSVVKHTIGGDGNFDFSVSGLGTATVATHGGAGTASWLNLAPGAFTVTEAVPSGWDFTSATCSTRNGPIATTPSGTGLTLALAAGADVTCTFTDTARASVTIVKSAIGGDGNFPFTLSGQPSLTVATANGQGSRSWTNLVPGSYAVAEVVPSGWDLNSATCAAGAEPIATTPAGSGVAFMLPPGASVTCSFIDTARASVTVVKETDGGDGTFAFSLTGQPAASVTTHSGSGRAQWANLVPGYFTLTETVPFGWDLGSTTCVSGASSLPTQAAPNGLSFVVPAGADVTCTFADTARGSITVVKNSVGGDGAFPFSLTAQPGQTVTTAGGTGARSWTNLVPGSYNLAETVPAGWDLDSVNCAANGVSLAAATSGSGTTFTLAPGADVTCTFVDIARGSITVVKRTAPSSASAVGFAFDGAPFTLLGNGGATTFGGLTSGDHTVAEHVAAGWTLTSIDCASASVVQNGSEVVVTLAPGQHVVCVFTDTQLASVTVVKQAVGGDGAFNFSLSDNSDHVVTTNAGAGTSTWTDLLPGAYSVTEHDSPGWDFTGLACDQSGVVTGNSAVVSLAPGAHATCTFTNSHRGTVTVVKQTDGGDGTFTFSLAGLPTHDITTSGGTGSAEWNDVQSGPTSIGEAVPAGWRLDGVTCTADGSPLPTIATASGASFLLPPGADATCTFTDTKLGSVTVVKDAIGGDGTFDFALSNLGTKTVTTSNGTGSAVWTDVDPASLTLNETVPDGWDFGNAACTLNGSQLATSDVTNGVEFALPAGGQVVCTFTDAARGSITVVKHTAPEVADSFPFTFDGTPFAVAGNGGSQTFAGLHPTTYTIAENVPSGWQLASVDCGAQPIIEDGTSITVMVDPGAQLTCTFTDTKFVASIALSESIDGSPAQPGYTVFYTFVVTNTGQTTLSNLTLSDDVLGTITLPVGELAPSETTSVVAMYNVPGDAPPGQPIIDTATTTGTPPVGSDVTATSTGHLDVETIIVSDT